MKAIFGFISLGLSAMLLQACTIPPASLNWRTEPGKIQRINYNPDSPRASAMGPVQKQASNL